MESFIYTRPFTYELKGKGENEELILDIDISSNDLDLVDDIVSGKCLNSMKEQIEAGNVKFDLEHEAFRGGSHEEKEINKTKVPVGRMDDPTIKGRIRKNGFKALVLNVKGIVNRFEDRYSKTKGSIVNRFLDAASIAFIPTEAHTEVREGKTIRILDDVKLLNVALTGNPVNTAAQMQTIMTKSLDALEEYKTAKKDNPDIEDLLEVKSKNELKRETGSDKEKRKLRKEALGEDESEDEEETKKYGKKKEVKSYEKDGAHAHTEQEPLGLHNHPEIENAIRFIHERIDNLLESSKPEAEEIKDNSHSSEKNLEKQKKEEKTMTETEKQSPDVEKDKEETVKEETSSLSEIKSMIEGLKSMVEANKEEIKSLKEVDIKDVKAPELEVNSKATQDNVDVNAVAKIEIKTNACLGELR